MHSSISVILLDAKRGTVIAPISLHSLSACECLIALGSFRNAQFGETLGTTFYSIRQPDRSPIPIAYGRGHPFEPIAGSSLAELPPQGINVATKRLHQEYRRRSPTTAAATAKLLALPGGPADGGVVWLCNQAEFYACSRSQKGRLAIRMLQPSRKRRHVAASFDPASRRTAIRPATGRIAFSMLTVMLRMLGIVCILGALLGGAAAARGFRGGPQMGFGPHPRFFPHPGFVPRPGFGPHRAFVPGRAFDNRRFFFGGVFVAPPILAPPYPVYPFYPYYYSPYPYPPYP